MLTRGVTLDYTDGNAIIEGTVVAPRGVRPDTIFIWAYFINPSISSGSWSDEPFALPEPFARGDTARFTARGHFHWWNNRNMPVHDGFLARVYAATTREGARVPVRLRSYEMNTLVPVHSRMPGEH
jgi:hypothetical protein